MDTHSREVGYICCHVLVELIKAQGDWKSNSYERYLDNVFINWLKAVVIVAKHVIND